jgi:DNA-directed RNA polymerase specialized sigma24 family protein
LTALDDGELAALAIDRQGEAFAELYDRHEQRACGFCLWMLGSPHDAADATQETSVRLLRRLPGLAGRELNFVAYPLKTARHACYDMIESGRRVQPVAEALEPAGSEPGSLEEDLRTGGAAGGGARRPTWWRCERRQTRRGLRLGCQFQRRLRGQPPLEYPPQPCNNGRVGRNHKPNLRRHRDGRVRRQLEWNDAARLGRNVERRLRQQVSWFRRQHAHTASPHPRVARAARA